MFYMIGGNLHFFSVIIVVLKLGHNYLFKGLEFIVLKIKKKKFDNFNVNLIYLYPNAFKEVYFTHSENRKVVLSYHH